MVYSKNHSFTNIDSATFQRTHLDTLIELSSIHSGDDDDDGNDGDEEGTDRSKKNEEEYTKEENRLVKKITLAIIPWFCAVELVQVDLQILKTITGLE